jgi:hypothetical protein
MASRRRRRSSNRQRALAVGFGLALVVALLVLAEGALRLLGVEPAYQADAIGGWRMLPQQTGQVVRTREGDTFVLSTNAEGMRTTLPQARRADRWRVAVMGDSIVFGWGVDDGQTVADGLAVGLQAALGAPVEVLNAAQPGYSTAQTAHFLNGVVADWKPDLVVVFLAMHDHNRVLVSDRENLRGADGPAAAVRVALARHSRLYQALRQQVVPLSREPFLMPGQDSSEPRVERVSDAERAVTLREMRERVAGWGGALALGHMPFLGDLEAGAALPRDGADWAGAFAAEEGLAIVDLRACCGPDAGDLVLPNDPGHLSAAGNRAAGVYGAGAVADLLRAMGAPDGPPPGAGQGSRR